MGWGSKSELPEELRDMDPKDIVAAVRRSKELETELTTTKNDLTTTKNAFESFQGEFDAKVEAKVNEMVTAATTRQQQQQRQQEPPADFLTNPDQAFADRIKPLVAISLQTSTYVAKNAAREKFQRKQRDEQGKNFDGYFFEKFENEVDALSRTVPTAQLTNPETWEHLYYNVKGRHADEIAAQFREGKLDNVIESGHAGSGRPLVVQDNDKLTPQEERLAAKLGQKPEEYLKMKKSINTNPLGVNLNV